MICKNYRSNETLADRVCTVTNSEREEYRITGHVLGADSYRIPADLIKYHANSINLFNRTTFAYQAITLLPAINQAFKNEKRRWRKFQMLFPVAQMSK